MAGNILSNCPFIAAKQASKMHTPEQMLNDWSSIQVSKLLFAIVWHLSYLLMSSVLGWKQSQRQVTHYTLCYPGITQKFSVVDNTFLPCQDRLRVRSPELSQIRLNQHFQCSTVSLSDHDQTRGFQYVSTNSHVRNLAFLTQNTTFYMSLSLASSFLSCNS